MGVTLVKNKKHMVVKRDGRLEPYNPDKLRKVILWATNNNEEMTNQLLESLNVKIYDKIPIQKLFDEVITTAANLISLLYPQWDEVAKKLYLLKIYKETWGLKKTGEYPSFNSVIFKGIDYGVYDPKIVEYFTSEELEELGNYIDPNRDFLFNYAGLRIFFKKYCLNYTKTKKLELPQHTYMRIAMYSFHNESDKDLRMKLIKEKYDMLSNHLHTEATPKMINSFTPTPQLASCVLVKPDDDTYSITKVAEWIAVMSKYGGGIGIDMSYIRSIDSPVKGNRGISSGPIPYVKLYEAVISGWRQGKTRRGAGIIYFPFWHYNVLDFIKAKDPATPEQHRANKLQYAMKWYKKFTKQILNNEETILFDPKDTPDLLESYGIDFEDAYTKYANLTTTRKKKVKAIEIAEEFLNMRKTTGNVYIMFMDNVNEQRMGEEVVTQSNLCTEVVLPTKPPRLLMQKGEVYFDDVYFTKKDPHTEAIDFYEPGEMALCNLASIDLHWWYNAGENEKVQLARNLLRAFDNTIDTQFYPVFSGKYANIRRRPIGIGAYNLAKLYASLSIKWDSDDAKEIIHNLFEDLTYIFLNESVNLAKERGPYYTIHGSKWEEGNVPLDVSILHNRIGNKRPDLNRHLNKDWDLLRQRIKDHGVRFSYHFAIAPTANSVKAINATESTEPVVKLFVKETGAFSEPFIVPGLQRGFDYHIAWDISPKVLIELAAIRQKFIDQAQSVNLYYVKPDSLTDLLDDIIYAEVLGLKTLYYMKTPKAGETEHCDSCVL